MADDRTPAQQLGDLVVDLRKRRKPIEEKWLQIHLAYRNKETRRFFKSEIFNHSIPAFRRAVERATTRVVQMLLPSPEFFEVFPGEELSDEKGDQAEAVRAYFAYLFAKKLSTKPFVSQLGRTFYLYGRAIAKVGVRLSTPAPGIVNIWPTTRAVDPFMFYVFPETASSADEAQVIVEDHLMPWDTYQGFVRRGLAKEIDQGKLSKPDFPDHQKRRLQESDLQPPTDTPASADMPLTNFVALSEVWFLRGGVWQMNWLAWNVPDAPLLVRELKSAPIGRHPYRMAFARQLPGEHYTTSMGDDIEPFQGMLADQYNMTLEGQALAFSPVAVIDPTLVGRANSLVWRPRAKWFADPNAVKFMQAPDTATSGLRGIQMTLGLVDSFSGSSPLGEGQPTRNLPRAGFAVSSLLSLALADIREVASLIEDEILTPMLADLHALTLRFVPPTQIIKIPGTESFPPRSLNVGDLAGDWDFKWVGSLQSQDLQVRAQRLMSFLGVLSKLAEPLSADLASKGKRINWEALVKRIWRDGLGERGVDSIIEEASPEQLALAQQLAAVRQRGGGGTPIDGGQGI